MNKSLFLIPLLLIIPLSSYASDQSFTLDQIFGHIINFNLGDRLVLFNNDTNFSHSFNAISKDGYTRNTPSLFPQMSYRLQFEQPGNYSITDGVGSSKIGFINVISSNPIQSNQTITNNITPTFSFSNATNTITTLPDTTTSTSGDATYWKSQALTWKFLAQQYYQQLQAYQNK